MQIYRNLKYEGEKLVDKSVADYSHKFPANINDHELFADNMINKAELSAEAAKIKAGEAELRKSCKTEIDELWDVAGP